MNAPLGKLTAHESALNSGCNPPSQINELDRRFRAPLISFFRRRGATHAHAEDLTQEAFVRLIAYDRANHVRSVDGLIFQIAANLMRDSARASRKYGVPPVGQIETERDGEADQGVDEFTPERILQGRQDVLAAVNALQELDGRTLRIFAMHRLDKQKHREIAAAVGVSVSLVEKVIRNAQRHLADRTRARTGLSVG